MDISKFRKLVALDEEDPLSRFALGQALFRDGSADVLTEAAEHLRFANAKAPDHLATYLLLGQVLIKSDHKDEAQEVLAAGCKKVEDAGGGMGRDLGPVMADLMETL